jgi:hypothetical protein
VALKAGESTVLELIVARRQAALTRGRLQRALAQHVLARVRLSLLLEEIGGVR